MGQKRLPMPPAMITHHVCSLVISRYTACSVSRCLARLELLVHVHFGQWIDEIGSPVVKAMAFVSLAQLWSFHEDAFVETEHRPLGKFLEQRAWIAIVFAQHP